MAIVFWAERRSAIMMDGVPRRANYMIVGVTAEKGPPGDSAIGCDFDD